MSKHKPTPPAQAIDEPTRAIARTITATVEQWPEHRFPSFWESVATGTLPDGRAFEFGMAINGSAFYLTVGKQWVECLPTFDMLKAWASAWAADNPLPVPPEADPQ